MLAVKNGETDSVLDAVSLMEDHFKSLLPSEGVPLFITNIRQGKKPSTLYCLVIGNNTMVYAEQNEFRSQVYKVDLSDLSIYHDGVIMDYASGTEVMEKMFRAFRDLKLKKAWAYQKEREQT